MSKSSSSEEDEFRARLEEEREFAARVKEELTFERRRMRETVAELRKGQQAIVDVATNVIKQAMSKPAPVMVVPTLPPKPKAVSHNWELVIEERDGQMMRTVVAYRDGKKAMRFDMIRDRNGYVNSIQSSRYE
jgi:hypothetical protein